MIPTNKRIVYEYKCRQFWKKGKSVLDSYRCTINGKDLSPDKFFKIKLYSFKTKKFFVSQRDYETKDGDMCHEVIYCTFRQVKE